MSSDRYCAALVAIALCFDGIANAQAQPTPLLIHKGIFVPIELAAPVSSESAQNGDRFPIRTFEPVVSEGTTLIPVGAVGEGEVIHAAKARGSGMPGELIVAVRFVRCGNTEIPIGHLQFSDSGRDQTMAWIIQRSTFTHPGQVKGSATQLPAGTRGIAKVRADVEITAEHACQPGTIEPK
ncbi:hypothetical protein LZ016_00100 [Sphingomonas sp. SM33]|uniref:Uncharacterized protein n=1 Tax=Sphingomonas telluris TaxID=2907998 RepID=A0ABS9VHS0_9SPHN|nr:hypothetical protein [Sphingomonas telluris]MCH8614511.1 hypothetical protein [Sphingomonas telluris]